MTQDFFRTKGLDNSDRGRGLMKVAANEKDNAVNIPKRLFRIKTPSQEASNAKLNTLSKLKPKITRNMTLNTLGLVYSLSREDSNHNATGIRQRFKQLKIRSK
jgi:hypothetical protein